MPNSRSDKNDFIEKITRIIEENISNEQFGVSELADSIGMSRSNLLRKVKKHTDLSVSQFIRNIRLKSAKQLLEETSFTVSEISYKVGFGSPSYFIKCFGDLYGYPPGETTKIVSQEDVPEVHDEKSVNRTRWIKWSLIGLLIIVLGYLLSISDVFEKKTSTIDKNKSAKKSIAVLPFINDSSDSANVYIINGLMESTLNNLQKIEDLRVISRTSVEKYRRNLRTTPEIAKELNVTYLIEGSGQKIGNQILLNIQLIEAATDNHLWSKQYKNSTEDIFSLQAEVAKNIAEEIQVIITPEEVDRIEKKPTNDLVAYDLFLQGLDLLNKPTPENLEKSIPYFTKAIRRDTEFARAYAAIAIAYYLLDEGKAEKQFSDSINYYSDQAMFFDSKLPQSLIAKALFYMEHYEYELAVPYFEKALEVSPNNDLVLIFLVDLYVNHLPNSEKYLEYALKGLEVDIVAAYDSATASYSFLHISNAFIQSGFVDEAEKYIDKSLEYFPGNLYSQYLKAYILFAKNKDLNQLKDLLLATFEKDKSRLDILQEVAKAYYYLGDYQTSYTYYKKFAELREAYKLDIYNSENAKIAYVFDQVGEKELSEKYLEKFKSDAENMQSIYKHYNLAVYYSYKGDAEKAIEHLELFSEEENFHYWTILFTPIDPLVENMKAHPNYKRIFSKLLNKFNRYHKRVEVSLNEKGLL
ncbi:helix-turn-helix domain-containing protein [Prolixibacteraceae bacterium Z1-6]|uniref:Helix-turn-helix domain-containing protein n=1 Tax=Draconibacterium aestuarii TaxID=2998507 RepID=A0A9X3F988_9BACT|nr:helix-turn-helix domain-containing protein [Prolixibacteraceae bacterium Z1-6]